MRSGSGRANAIPVATILLASSALWGIELDRLVVHGALGGVVLLLRAACARSMREEGLVATWGSPRALLWGATGFSLGFTVAVLAGLGKWRLLPSMILWGCLIAEACFGVLLGRATRAQQDRFASRLVRGATAGALSALILAAPTLLIADSSWDEVWANLVTALTIFVPLAAVLGLVSPSAEAPRASIERTSGGGTPSLL